MNGVLEIFLNAAEIEFRVPVNKLLVVYVPIINTSFSCTVGIQHPE